MGKMWLEVASEETMKLEKKTPEELCFIHSFMYAYVH